MRKLVLIAAALLLLTGCGSDDDGGDVAADQIPFDQAFIDAMVPHHESAIEMAEAAKDAGLTEPELVAIADAIMATQQQEIDQMLAWREEWYGSSERGSEEQALEAMGLTSDEAALHGGELSEDDVDGSFAGMMIGHHEGAIRMAELAADRAEHPEIVELAAAIIDAQQREIDTMEKYATEGH